MIEAAADLYALDPAEFVAARTKLAKQLKADGRREDAATVAKLTKPSLVEHALNRASRDEPELVRGWASAVRDAEQAQSAAIGGGDAASLREATAALRSVTAALIDVATAAAGDDSKRGDVIAQLRRLTNTAGAAQLVAGTVGSGLAESDDLFAGAPEPPRRPATPKPAKPDKTPKPDTTPEPDKPEKAEKADKPATPAKSEPEAAGAGAGSSAEPEPAPAQPPAPKPEPSGPTKAELAERRQLRAEHRRALELAQHALRRAERRRDQAAQALRDADDLVDAAQVKLEEVRSAAPE